MLTTVILSIVVIAILALAFAFVWKNRAAKRPATSASPNGKAASPAGPDQPPDRELHQVKSGDVVALWSGEELLVEQALDCQDNSTGRPATWRWLFLEGGRVISSTPTSAVYYPATEVLHQGSEGFERLTADVNMGGALKTFEQRVRDNVVGSDPVFFSYDNKRFRVQSTGTFATPGQAAPAREVWEDVSTTEGENVYFRLAADDGEQLLGIWTTHIAILRGRTLNPADVREVYRTGR